MYGDTRPVGDAAAVAAETVGRVGVGVPPYLTYFAIHLQVLLATTLSILVTRGCDPIPYSCSTTCGIRGIPWAIPIVRSYMYIH